MFVLHGGPAVVTLTSAGARVATIPVFAAVATFTGTLADAFLPTGFHAFGAGTAARFRVSRILAALVASAAAFADASHLISSIRVECAAIGGITFANTDAYVFFPLKRITRLCGAYADAFPRLLGFAPFVERALADALFRVTHGC